MVVHKPATMWKPGPRPVREMRLQARQGEAVNNAAWLVVWLIHLLAWFVIAAMITND